MLCIAQMGMAQEDDNLTRIWGTVNDATTGEPLPYVNISFQGTTIGTVSDINGKFYLESYEATDTLKISFIGFDPTYYAVKKGQTQTISIALKESSVQLENITISSKKLRYRNKDNPAVSIIKLILRNRDHNRPEALDYFEYDKYEKVEFDLNNITEEFRKKRALKNFQLIFDYVDTSEVNGKTYLPIFLRETSSKVYYRQSPQKSVEYRLAEKMTGFEDYFDSRGVSQLIDKMYQDIDIYDNNVNVLTQKFVSPISNIGPITYKYYIDDTVSIEGSKYYKVAFQPRNPNDLAFVGNMLVTTDSAYAVKNISMRITERTNLNYVEDLFIDQEFEKNQFGTYDLIKDKISIDFNLLDPNGLGLFGKRTVSYRNLVYNQPRDDKTYKSVNNLVISEDATEKGEEYWEEARHMDLSRSEQGVFNMIEEVKELPAFKRFMDLLTFILVGYIDLGKVEIGPVGSFFSWNEVEGFRGRFGGKTTRRASEKYELAAHVAYGSFDQAWKYSGQVTRYFSHSPLHAVRLTYENEIENPGQQLQFANEDNFLLSIRRGVNNKRFYYERAEAEYMREVGGGVSFIVGGKMKDLMPGGILSFLPGENVREEYTTPEEREQQRINVLESNLTLRFAPNEQYYEGESSRTQIYNKHPIFTVKYDKSYEDFLGTDYGYDKLSFGVFKRTFVPPIGFFDLEIEARKLWGQVPYPLLHIPTANQTYSYMLRAYNLMNYLEFVSDEYVSVQYAHYFNGFFMNKIPVLKRMKLRSIITFKGLLGNLTTLNDPSQEANNNLPDLPAIEKNDIITPVTFPLDHYIETSIGIGNIINIFRIDLVKRWTQLDRPDVASGYSIRARLKIEF